MWTRPSTGSRERERADRGNADAAFARRHHVNTHAIPRFPPGASQAREPREHRRAQAQQPRVDTAKHKTPRAGASGQGRRRRRICRQTLRQHPRDPSVSTGGFPGTGAPRTSPGPGTEATRTSPGLGPAATCGQRQAQEAASGSERTGATLTPHSQTDATSSPTRSPGFHRGFPRRSSEGIGERSRSLLKSATPGDTAEPTPGCGRFHGDETFTDTRAMRDTNSTNRTPRNLPTAAAGSPGMWLMGRTAPYRAIPTVPLSPITSGRCKGPPVGVSSPVRSY